MFELKIKYADGSIYWVEHFNSLNDMNKWLAVERTRPYWLPEFTTEIVDHTPPPPSQAQIDADLLLKQQIQTLKQRLKTLAQQSDFTAAELKEFVLKMGKMLFLMNSLD